MIKFVIIASLICSIKLIDDIIALQLRQQFIQNANDNVKEINDLINSIKIIIKQRIQMMY